MNQLKHCPRCKETKPASAFGSNRSRKDGLQTHCKECRADIHRERKIGPLHLVTIPPGFKICYSCMTLKIDAEFSRHSNRGDGLQTRCKVCMGETLKEWTADNRDKVNTAAKRWRRSNPEKVRAGKKRRRQANPEKNRVRAKKWRQSNSYAVKAHNANNKAKFYGSEGRLTPKDVATVFDRWSYCLLCGGVNSLTIDHITPLSQGGGNTVDNLQTLCYKCNQKKNRNTIDYRPKGGHYEQ